MEDFIKNKLSEYKPVFQEAYWEDASKQIKKRRRRKLVIFWLIGGMSFAILSLVVFNHVFEEQPPRQVKIDTTYSNNSKIDKATTNLSAEKTKSTDGSGSEQSTSNSTPVTQKDNSNSIKLNSSYTNTTSSKISKNSSASSQQPIKLDKTNSSKKIGAMNSAEHPSHDLKEDISTSAIAVVDNGQINTEEEGRTQIQIQPSQAEIDSKSAAASTDVVSIANLKKLSIALFDNNVEIDLVPRIEPVEITHSVRKYVQHKNVIDLSSGLLSSSDADIVHTHEIQLKRRGYFKNSPFYMSAGVGAGYGKGSFNAIDHERVVYRTFAENSVSQSLLPEEIFYLSIPVEIGFRRGAFSAGLTFTPEYLALADGNILTENEMKKVSAIEGIDVPQSFDVTKNTTTQTEQARLELDNIKRTTYSIGVNAGYQVGQHLSIGISTQYYVSGYFTLKKPCIEFKIDAGE